MEYKVAKTYENAERIGEPIENNGKLYTRIKQKCPRCNGRGYYAIGVKNGHLIPTNVDGGVCYKCKGKGYLDNVVRLYTNVEFEKIEFSKEIEKQKRIDAMNELTKKRLQELPTRRKEVMARLGFDVNGNTFMIMGNTFKIKDELKEKGCKFSKGLLWHTAELIELPKGYYFIGINFDDIYEWEIDRAMCNLKSDWEEVLNEIKELNYQGTSQYIGEVGERVQDLCVSLENIKDYDGPYGLTHCYMFKTTDDDIVMWWTAVELNIEIYENILITGTIKKLEIYNDEKTTYLTRCKIKEI